MARELLSMSSDGPNLIGHMNDENGIFNEWEIIVCMDQKRRYFLLIIHSLISTDFNFLIDGEKQK